MAKNSELLVIYNVIYIPYILSLCHLTVELKWHIREFRLVLRVKKEEIANKEIRTRDQNAVLTDVSDLLFGAASFSEKSEPPFHISKVGYQNLKITCCEISLGTIVDKSTISFAKQPRHPGKRTELWSQVHTAVLPRNLKRPWNCFTFDASKFYWRYDILGTKDSPLDLWNLRSLFNGRFSLTTTLH